MTLTRTTLLAGLLALVTTACTTVGGAGAPATPAPAGGSTAPATQPGAAWTVRTREHVDLWLHGYALLQQDTARVPFFRRGYRDRLLAERRSRNVTTALDVNRERLVARLTANPALVNGQFLPFYFASLADLQRAVELTLQTQGDPRRAGSEELAQYVALVSASFPTAADRDWLRTFMQSIVDEHRVFYQSYWAAQQAARADALAAVNTLWERHYPGFQRYLANTQQARGEMLLSLPLNGEGRTAEVGNDYFLVGVNFPETAAAAPEALYTFAHEIALATTTTAVNDNVTPAEQRSGVAATYTSNAAVRGGLLLLERAAPDLVPGYMRYYLAAIGQQVPGSNVRAAFEAAFPLPAPILAAITTQMGTILQGI